MAEIYFSVRIEDLRGLLLALPGVVAALLLVWRGRPPPKFPH